MLPINSDKVIGKIFLRWHSLVSARHTCIISQSESLKHCGTGAYPSIGVVSDGFKSEVSSSVSPSESNLLGMSLD